MDELVLLRAYRDDRQYLKEYAHGKSLSVHELILKIVQELKKNNLKIGS